MNNLLIYGPPASGKSFLGKSLASAFGIKYFDLDKEIEERTGDSIQQIMSYLGEEGFRNVEKDIFEDLILTYDGAIISLGGGTLLNEESRKLAERENVVICLNLTEDSLTKNFENDTKIRPLCNSKNSLDDYKKLLLARKQHYSSFDHQITGAFVDPKVGEENGLSTFLIGPDSSKLITIVLKIFFKESKVKVVYDKNVRDLANSIILKATKLGCQISSFQFKASESKKTLSSVEDILEDFKRSKLNRNDIVLSIGGGITSDVVGFAASQWKRGIRWISLPTTLLSMIDASTGGKTGVNFGKVKNLIGSFHKPTFVIIDPLVLQTLSEKEFKNGYAEAYKHYLLDKHLYDSTADIVMKLKRIQYSLDSASVDNARFIGNLLNVKLRTVKSDPFETTGERAKLNLGHTVAHAVEMLSKNKISHGEAVSIGLCEETRIAFENGILSDRAILEEMMVDLDNLDLQTTLPKKINKEKLLEAMSYDKKNSDSRIKLVVLSRIGNTSELYL